MIIIKTRQPDPELEQKVGEVVSRQELACGITQV